MKPQLKPLGEQVIVITGATSGIGLATARLAAQKGARVVLVAREESDLQRATQEINATGGQAIYAVADVADFAALQRAADLAASQWGGIDTWINDAGVSIYGELRDVPVADARRLFDTNYWGVVNGSLIAVSHLEQRGGGALINVGSTVSDRALPLQGHYSASKHAVKGFTDALRMELEKKGTPVSVTLVKPGSIDTPFTSHARNYMPDAEPELPPPVYHPDVVADAILFCAERVRRDITVGSGGKMIGVMGLTPRLADRFMEATQFDQQKKDEPARADREDTLYEPLPNSGHLRGTHKGHVASTSLYTTAAKHPLIVLGAVAAFGAAFALASGGRSEKRDRKHRTTREDADLSGSEHVEELTVTDRVLFVSEEVPISAAALVVDPLADVTTAPAVSVEVLA